MQDAQFYAWAAFYVSEEKQRLLEGRVVTLIYWSQYLTRTGHQPSLRWDAVTFLYHFQHVWIECLHINVKAAAAQGLKYKERDDFYIKVE